MKLILTCEHGGNMLPPGLSEYFKTAPIESHRAYDPGALSLFFRLRPMACFSVFSTISRLLVEINRSPDNPELFSEFSTILPETVKQNILQEHYFPFRNSAEEAIREILNTGKKVLHLSVHSFTPELNGEVRRGDLGLLYDPARPAEQEFCEEWAREIYEISPDIFVRMNYPYMGTDDGFTSYLRTIFRENYLGIELEVNQNRCTENSIDPTLARFIFGSLQKMVQRKTTLP